MSGLAVIRIAVTGVESTGKTTLTEALSAQLGGLVVRECARYDAEVIAGQATLATLERLAQAQAEACEVAVQQAAATGAAAAASAAGSRAAGAAEQQEQEQQQQQQQQQHHQHAAFCIAPIVSRNFTNHFARVD